MFDISFSELALCFVVALVVLGPERLPKVARTVGRWSGQARAYMRNLSNELERETSVADIKRQFQEAQQALRESKSAIEESARSLTSDVKDRITPATTRADITAAANAAASEADAIDAATAIPPAPTATADAPAAAPTPTPTEVTPAPAAEPPKPRPAPPPEAQYP